MPEFHTRFRTIHWEPGVNAGTYCGFECMDGPPAAAKIEGKEYEWIAGDGVWAEDAVAPFYDTPEQAQAAFEESLKQYVSGRDAVLLWRYPPDAHQSKGRYRVAAALWVVSKEWVSNA